MLLAGQNAIWNVQYAEQQGEGICFVSNQHHNDFYQWPYPLANSYNVAEYCASCSMNSIINLSFDYPEVASVEAAKWQSYKEANKFVNLIPAQNSYEAVAEITKHCEMVCDCEIELR